MSGVPYTGGGRARNLLWLWISALVVALDQYTKYLVSSSLILHQPNPVLPHFNLTLMHNTGAAFSFLHDAAGWQRWFFLSVALLVGGAILAMLWRLQGGQRWVAVGLALILGGALGNVWDRAVLGYVIDFLHFYWGPHFFPAFNIADSAITVGATILIIDGLWPKRGER